MFGSISKTLLHKLINFQFLSCYNESKITLTECQGKLLYLVVQNYLKKPWKLYIFVFFMKSSLRVWRILSPSDNGIFWYTFTLLRYMQEIIATGNFFNLFYNYVLLFLKTKGGAFCHKILKSNKVRSFLKFCINFYLLYSM